MRRLLAALAVTPLAFLAVPVASAQTAAVAAPAVTPAVNCTSTEVSWINTLTSGGWAYESDGADWKIDDQTTGTPASFCENSPNAGDLEQNTTSRCMQPVETSYVGEGNCANASAVWDLEGACDGSTCGTVLYDPYYNKCYTDEGDYVFVQLHTCGFTANQIFEFEQS